MFVSPRSLVRSASFRQVLVSSSTKYSGTLWLYFQGLRHAGTNTFKGTPHKSLGKLIAEVDDGGDRRPWSTSLLYMGN